MRVAVYNRYWTTFGGAEMYGAGIAQVLARHHEVTLLGPDEIDPAVLAERLRLDLTGVGFQRVRDRPGAVTRASRGYDLLVNVSFMSDDEGAAPHNLYVTHFPAQGESDLSGPQKLAIRTLGPLVRAQAVDTAWGEGFFPREGRRPRYFWTAGEASFFVEARADRDVPVRMSFRHQRPADLPPAKVRIEVEGELAAELEVGGGGGRLDALRATPVVVPVRARKELGEVEVRIVSDTFVPAEHGLGDDDRTLGVAMATLHTGDRLRDRLGAALGAWWPLLYRPPPNKAFLDTYDGLVANSEFTRGWIRRWWHRDAVVLYPPAAFKAPGPKEPIILAVGRFFAPRAGHSKKQREMVEAFRRLTAGGRAEGWSLHLVGGCSERDRPYLDQVRADAAGLDVVFHVGASGAELADLYARGSIFWHAAGLGVQPEHDPNGMEHFGIAIVEAMSAGAVPVVLDQAGPAEIVEHDVSGLQFHDLDGLVAATESLLADPGRLERLSQGARQRAEHFGFEAFAQRLEAIVADVLSASGRAGSRPRAD